MFKTDTFCKRLCSFAGLFFLKQHGRLLQKSARTLFGGSKGKEKDISHPAGPSLLILGVWKDGCVAPEESQSGYKNLQL